VEVVVVVEILKLAIGDTFIDRLGSGRPVFVVHGGLGLSHEYLRPSMDPLAEDVELIFIDLLGNGRSGRLPPQFPTDHSVWVTQIDQVADALGFEHFTLLGHSHGGVIAQRYALARQERLTGLILVTTGPSFDHVELIIASLADRSTPEQFATFTTEIFVEQPDDATWASRWRTVTPLYYAVAPSDEVLDQAHAREIHRAEGFNACLLHVPGFDVREQLFSIAVPTLVIGGSHDFCFPREVVPGLLAERIPNAHLVMMEHSGHNPFAEEPEIFNDVIREFVLSL
jgi:proline iminopeptidase